MPNPSNVTRRAKAENIDDSYDSILTPSLTTKQDPEARSLFSPQNSQERSAQTSSTSFKFIKQSPKSGGALL